MKTFTPPRPFVHARGFRERREDMLSELRQGIAEGTIDPPIVPLLEDFARIRSCYTIQSCWGHFVHELQPETRNLAPVHDYRGRVEQVLYRIAYLALCIEESPDGHALCRELAGMQTIDPEFILFGSADFFWKMVPNTYVLQVVPEWGKEEDSMWVGIEEAIRLEEARARFFAALGKLAKRHTG